MDSWNEKQISSMRLGGNDSCNQFLAKYKVISAIKDDTAHNIFQKYNSPAAALYKDRLRAIVEGKEELPNDISKYQPAASSGGSGATSVNVAQGSDPLAGESNDDYVARQRLLQVSFIFICCCDCFFLF